MHQCTGKRHNLAPFLVIILLSLVNFIPSAEANEGEWLFWGHDINNSKFPSSETAINKDNIKNLKAEWVWEARSNVYVYPSIKDNWLYTTDYPLLSVKSVIHPEKDGGWLYAIDRNTGKTLWERSIYQYSENRANVVSRSSPAIFDDLIIIGDAVHAGTIAQGFRGSRAAMYGINRFNGELVWKTVVEDHFAAQITQSPVVHDGLVYVGVSSLELTIPGILGPAYSCCNFRGSMLALDARSGEILWKTYTIPENYGQTDLFSGGSVWGSSPSIDTERGLVYIATGNNYDVPSALKQCLRESENDSIQEEACYEKFDPADNYFNAILALDMKTGAVRWSQKVMRYDAWNFACLADFIPYLPIPQKLACPRPKGGDYDFGQAPMLIKDVTINGETKDLLVAGQKTGMFWAFDPEQNGKVIWATEVGPYGLLGGHEFGSATDGKRIYAQITNAEHKEFQLQAGIYEGQTAKGGLWAALDVVTGEILWQTPVPGSNKPISGGGIDHHHFGKDLALGFFALAMGPMTVANDIVYAGSLDGHMYALSGETGEILWSYKTDGSINSAPSIVDGSLYWGSGYWLGFPDNKLYKFSLE